MEGTWHLMLMLLLQADPSNIPVVFSANFSYSFLPSEAVSTYAPAAGSSTTFYGSITSAVGNIRDSLSAIGSTICACSCAHLPLSHNNCRSKYTLRTAGQL